MGTWVAEKITQKLIASSVIEEGDRELYIYGFFLLTNKILYFFVAVIVGTLASVTFESVIFYIVFMSLRTYAGGVHAKTEMSCTILTTLALTVSVLGIKQLNMHTGEDLPLLLLGSGSICILLFSPLDTADKPLTPEEKLYYRHICTRILGVYLLLIGVAWWLMRKNVACAIIEGIFLEGLLLLAGKSVKKD